MARITVEDCLDYVNNRFDLVLAATKRARKLALGSADPLVDWENDKPTVVALREIAAGHSFADDEVSEEQDDAVVPPQEASDDSSSSGSESAGGMHSFLSKPSQTPSSFV